MPLVIQTLLCYFAVHNISEAAVTRRISDDDHRYLIALTTGTVASLMQCAIVFVAVLVILILCLKIRRLKKSLTTISVTASQVQTKNVTISEVDLTCKIIL